MTDFTNMAEEELHNEFVSRGRAGESLQPIFAERQRRRNMEEAFKVARAGSSILNLAQLQTQRMIDEDCDQADERYCQNHFKGAIATAIEMLAEGIIGRAESLEEYIGAKQS